MKWHLTIVIVAVSMVSCAQAGDQNPMKEKIGVEYPSQESKNFVEEDGVTIADRFPAPNNYNRIEADSSSFAYNLRHLSLKTHGAVVKHYDGSSKKDRGVYIAVVNKDIGKKNLHQCADAVMRLRADYLYEKNRFDDIQFDLTNGFNVPYSEWMKGKRVNVVGNKTTWVQKTSPSNTMKDYWKYMEFIFSYAGTLSLDKELKSIQLKEMKIGDVFIKGGSPGHAVIIVDMIEDRETKDKKFLLAQSYMPAQEIQILRNTANEDINNPWYDLTDFESLSTPEWNFTANQLKRFVQ